MSANESQNRAWQWTGSGYEPADTIPLADRGFRYGMSVFETILVLGGRMVFAPAHLDKLRNACRAAGIPLSRVPGEFPALDSLGNGVIRIYVTAGDGDPAAPIESPRIFLVGQPRMLPARESWNIGLSAVPSDAPFAPALDGIKSGNYWRNCAALAFARAGGHDECLLFNAAGHLVSASMANVFLRVGGRWLCPPAATGRRPGVVHDWLLPRLRPAATPITRHDVTTADAGILTSSWIGVAPLRQIGARPLAIPDGSREITRNYLAEIGYPD